MTAAGRLRVSPASSFAAKMSDTGTGASSRIHSRLPSREIEAEVVKVPHHGSAGNLLDEFYESARPQVAVISAGADNSYGHPHSAVLDYLEESGVRIYRTDQNGAVQMWTDGSSLYCQPTKEKEEV